MDSGSSKCICVSSTHIKSSISNQANRNLFKSVSLSNSIINEIMKHLAITIMLFSTMSSFGQTRDFNEIPKDILEQLDKMGVDASPLLNSYEGTYLNMIFKDSLKGFDFTGKKVGFIYSGAKSDKQEYFSQVKDRYHSNSTPVGGSSLYIFDAAQRVESGGYDAAVVYWSKFFIPTKKVVKKLKTSNPSKY